MVVVVVVVVVVGGGQVFAYGVSVPLELSGVRMSASTTQTLPRRAGVFQGPCVMVAPDGDRAEAAYLANTAVTAKVGNRHNRKHKSIPIL